MSMNELIGTDTDWEVAKFIVGTVPDQYEIIYFFVMVLLIIIKLLVITSPLWIWKAGDR